MITVTRSGVVTSDIAAALHCGDQLTEVTLTLRYTREDPWAVTLDFADTDVIDVATGEHTTDTCAWRVSRDVLAVGQSRTQPHGDVLITCPTSRPIVLIDFYPGSSHESTLLMQRDVVLAFLQATYRSMPVGHEVVALDEVIDQILACG